MIYKQRSIRDVPSLVFFEHPSGSTLHLNWSTRDVPSLVLSITTQVDVRSTYTTKDVRSNVLRQRILRQLVPWIFVRGIKRYLRRLVLWNLLFKGKGTNQKNSQAVSPLNLLSRGGKENQKNSQAVSPLNLLARGRRKNQKNSQAISPLNLLARERRDEKIAHFCFLQNFHLHKNKV